MGKKNKSYAAAAARAKTPAVPTTTTTTPPFSPGASSRATLPSTPPPARERGTSAPHPNAQPQLKGTPASRTQATRPDPSESTNKFSAIAEENESSDGSDESGRGEDDSEEEETEAREIAGTSSSTKKKPTPGAEGAWIWGHLQEHAVAGTTPQKWVLDLAMGRFGGTPADYPQLQATLADTVSEVEALKKTVSALQHTRGRTYSNNNDRTSGRDEAEKPARRNRSLSRAGDKNGLKRKAQQSTNAAPARRGVDNPCDYAGCHYPSSHSRADCRYEESNKKRGLKVVKSDG